MYGTINAENVDTVEGFYECHAQTSELTGTAKMLIKFDDELNPYFSGKAITATKVMKAYFSESKQLSGEPASGTDLVTVWTGVIVMVGALSVAAALGVGLFIYKSMSRGRAMLNISYCLVDDD